MELFSPEEILCQVWIRYLRTIQCHLYLSLLYCVFVPGVCTWISKMESDLLCCMLWHLRAFYMHSFFQRKVRLSGEVFGRCRTPLVLTLLLTSFVCIGMGFVDWLEKGFTYYMRRVLKCALILLVTEFDCPEVTLCGELDVKIQLLTNCRAITSIVQ